MTPPLVEVGNLGPRTAKDRQKPLVPIQYRDRLRTVRQRRLSSLVLARRAVSNETEMTWSGTKEVDLTPHPRESSRT